MVLSDTAIQEYIQHGLISVVPAFDENQLRPFGLRVHLANEILVPEKGQFIDLENNLEGPKFTKLDLNSEKLILEPGDFVLASTIESFKIDTTLACRLDGRSTLARLGIMVHCSSTTIDGIHMSHRVIVLEISNVGSFRIALPFAYPIGMVLFETIAFPGSLSNEQNQYEEQSKVLPPNLKFKTEKYRTLG